MGLCLRWYWRWEGAISKATQRIVSLLCRCLPFCCCWKTGISCKPPTERKTWKQSLYSSLDKLKEQGLLQFLCGTGHRQSGRKTNVPQHGDGMVLWLEDRAQSFQIGELFFLQCAIRLSPQRENHVLERIDILPWRNTADV